MKKKRLIGFLYIVILDLILICPIPFIYAKNIESTPDNNYIWYNLNDSDKNGYYERILLSILHPYVKKAIYDYYGEDRPYFNDRIIYIQPINLSNEIKIEVETFTGAHNPPYGTEYIKFRLTSSQIIVTSFEHVDSDTGNEKPQY